MEVPASFGRWVRQRRKLLDLTQDDLARAVGCSAVTIRKLEADERRPSRQIAERLADQLRIAPQERASFIGMARAEAEPAPPAGPGGELQPGAQIAAPPAPLTRLIGRKHDLAAVRAALLRGGTRLLTLSGPPGIGKTRLALEAAGELRGAFADGVCFVGLAAVRDPELVLAAIAQALGLRERGGLPLAASARAYLADKRLLLLLDNFEQVAAAAPALVSLLEGAPGVKALITSRAVLQVRGEQVLPLDPLPLPDPAQPPDPRALARSPAVALFVERAQAANPAFALSAASAPAVAELCARLDGLPLAIELVAARARLLEPAALLAGLDRRLALLADGPRDLPERHQTLRSALDGSYALLDSPARALLRWLGVFAGGCTLEAIEAVASELRIEHEALRNEHLSAILNSQFSILHSLEALVDQSLLRREAGPRFTMLETIREYALERLEAAGEAAAARAAHARYFLGLALRAAPELHGPDQAAWFDTLAADYPNLRAALEWLLDSGAAGDALRLAGALWWFWSVRGSSEEGRRWLERALAATLDEQPSADLAAGLHAAGHLALFQGDLALARERLGASAAAWRALAAREPTSPAAQRGLAAALSFLIVAVQFQGDLEARAELVAEYLALNDTLDDPRSRAMLSFSMGRAELLQFGNHLAARAQLECALALFRELGDLWSIAQLQLDLGLAALYQAEYPAARASYEETLALARALHDSALAAAALNNLGEVARCQGDGAAAGQLYAESLRLYQATGSQTEVPRLLHNLGYLALRHGDHDGAADSFHASLSRFQQLGMARGVAEALAGLAAVAASSDPAGAARLWGAAEAMRAAEGTPVWPADLLERARYQAIARASLGAAEWDAAWQAGQADPAAALLVAARRS